ncbi:hypothetical protein LAY57_17960 [Argonema antarcticum A004/B2]|nr:hypothetical protein [Argonema antarcticum A004/B2]
MRLLLDFRLRQFSIRDRDEKPGFFGCQGLYFVALTQRNRVSGMTELVFYITSV